MEKEVSAGALGGLVFLSPIASSLGVEVSGCWGYLRYVKSYCEGDVCVLNYSDALTWEWVPFVRCPLLAAIDDAIALIPELRQAVETLRQVAAKYAEAKNPPRRYRKLIEKMNQPEFTLAAIEHILATYNDSSTWSEIIEKIEKELNRTN